MRTSALCSSQLRIIKRWIFFSTRLIFTVNIFQIIIPNDRKVIKFHQMENKFIGGIACCRLRRIKMSEMRTDWEIWRNKKKTLNKCDNEQWIPHTNDLMHTTWTSIQNLPYIFNRTFLSAEIKILLKFAAVVTPFHKVNHFCISFRNRTKPAQPDNWRCYGQ